jgi:hypothetical protein
MPVGGIAAQRMGANVNEYDDPDELWHTTGLGREEYIQRLLSGLILRRRVRGWNQRFVASPRGTQYVRALHRRSFDSTPGAELEFVDEFELPRRHDLEKAGWPDQAALWDGRLFVIELKTERRSHRRGQLEHYLDLCAHHYPKTPVDFLYLTPAMEVVTPRVVDGVRFEHTSWADVGQLIEDVWGSSPIDVERRTADVIGRWIEDIEAGTPPPPKRRPAFDVPEGAVAVTSPDASELALDVAAEVQRTGRQGAVDVWPGSPEDLERLRLEIREAIEDGVVRDGVALTHVRPWLWSRATSGGEALTASGQTYGFELRISRYREPVRGARPGAGA